MSEGKPLGGRDHRGAPSTLLWLEEPEDGWCAIHDPDDGATVTLNLSEALAALGKLAAFVQAMEIPRR